ncbi:uncharacterized protein LOC135112397 [Scylla paramamosain]|uniref:uncharacterized protein LOC135112397 n=1 Tax=Scylla paramamosain TaxID=85552 RepID=UPI003082B0A0
MVWWTRGCRETADRMEATDERRAGQAMAADRQTETDWIRKYYYLVRQAHWKLSVCCGTWQEPSVEEHTLSLHQSADLGGSEVSLQTGDPFSWTQLESDTRFKRESF